MKVAINTGTKGHIMTFLTMHYLNKLTKIPAAAASAAGDTLQS